MKIFLKKTPPYNFGIFLIYIDRNKYIYNKIINNEKLNNGFRNFYK